MDRYQPRLVYEFGGFQLDLLQRRLRIGATSTPVPLTPRVFDTLAYFVEHRGELLEKSALMAALWPHLVVEESNLTQTIHTLRRVLGERPDEHRFIVTVPGRGYRFVADVVAREEPTPAPQPELPLLSKNGIRHRLGRAIALISIAAVLLVAAAIIALLWRARAGPPADAALASIAVLPLANLTGDPSQQYFIDGLSEELIGTLASVSGLEVPARTSLFAYRSKSIDARQIGRELGVTHVLEGSVRSSGAQIRLSVQLVDARTGYHIWARNYDTVLTDLFAVQDELAVAIVNVLAPNVGSTTFSSATRARPTRDVEAYRLWLQASKYEPTEENLRRSVELLRQATTRDPQFASAWLAMAVAFAMSLGYGYQLPGALGEFEHSVERAIALAPSSPEADWAQGLLHLARGDWLAADNHWRATLVKFPIPPKRSARAMDLLAGTGRVHEALRVVEQQHEAAPGDASIVMQLAVLNVMLRRDAEALRCLDIARGAGVPEDLPPMHAIRSSALRRAGRYADAAREAAPGLPEGLRMAGSEELLEQVYRGFKDPAHRAPALEAVGRFVSEMNSQHGHTYPYAMLIYTMNWYTQLGALDRAYALAERWIDHYEQTGLVGVPFTIFLWDDDMRPFRRDPRFHDFVARLNYTMLWQRNGLPDDCSMREAKLTCK
jgi:TolB-like protein/DNA-binding winged helix-turn-helix (wHTH) protein